MGGNYLEGVAGVDVQLISFSHFYAAHFHELENIVPVFLLHELNVHSANN